MLNVFSSPPRCKTKNMKWYKLHAHGHTPQYNKKQGKLLIMALASCLHVWLCACIFKCLCRGKSSKWNELSREEGAHMAVVISALSVFSHQALCIWVKKRRRRRRLIWKPIRRVRPFSNYTEIILIASESCRALNFISLLLFAYEWMPPPSPLFSWLASPYCLLSFP